MHKSPVELHWDYLTLLDRDLKAISETVELCEDNYHAFGPRILQLVLGAGDEMDTALKTLIAMVVPGSKLDNNKRPNMNDFKHFIAGNLKADFSGSEVAFLHTGIVLCPWRGVCADPDDSVSWWGSYINAKHHRVEHYEDANLESAIYLLAALFVVDCHMVDLSSSDMRANLYFAPLTMIDKPFHSLMTTSY